MSSFASSPFKTKPSKQKIQIVMNDNQIFYPSLEKMERFFYCLSTPVHKGHRFDKDDTFSIDPSCSIERFVTFGGNKNVVYFGEPIHYLKPDIVSCPTIVDPRIPQSYDDFHTRLFFLLLLLLLLCLCLRSCLRNHLLDHLLLNNRRHHGGNGKVGIE